MQIKSIIGLVLITVVISALGSLVYEWRITKEQLETKKAELLAASAEIKSQNEAIEKLRLDVDTYKNKRPEIIEKIVTKYKEIPVASGDATYEQKWESLENYVRVFYNRHGAKNYLGERVEAPTPEELKTQSEKHIQELESKKLEKAQEVINNMRGIRGTGGVK